MSTSSRTGCWRRLSWCICSCGGQRVPQVSPGDPIPTIIPGNNNKNAVQIPIQSEPSKSVGMGNGNNGHVNLFFVPDENGEVSYNTDAIDGQQGPSKGNIAQEVIDFHLKHSIFIELEKDRKLRVVHLKEINTEESKQYNSPLNASSSGEEVSPELTDSESNEPPKEEEDEYWFTKWTRKPRFRSIFEKNTIHIDSKEDDPSDKTNENNNTVEESGQLSKDFELARTAAAAKRRAWAYNNGNNCDSVVEQSTEIEQEDEEFNSICMLDSNLGNKLRLNKTKGQNDTLESSTGDFSLQRSPVKVESVKVQVQNHPLEKSPSQGFTNLGFEQDDDDENEGNGENICGDDETEAIQSSSSPKFKFISPEEDSLTVLEDLKKESNIQLTEIDLTSPKPPLLFFIHGISGSSDVWKTQMDFFHNLGYEIVAPDLLGHGYSSTPYNSKYYFFESLAQDLITVFDHFIQEGRKVVLIGHGYGACLASVIVRLRPKNVCLLISIAGGGPTPLVSRVCCRSSLIPFYCRLFHTAPRIGRFDNPDLKHILPPIVHQYLLTGQVWGDGDSAFYRRIIVPTLLVYGMKDKVVNLVEECEMERTIPKSFLEIINNAGHMVMFDEPHRLNKMLGKFIQSWS